MERKGGAKVSSRIKTGQSLSDLMNECEQFFQDFDPGREEKPAMVREVPREEDDMVV